MRTRFQHALRPAQFFIAVLLAAQPAMAADINSRPVFKVAPTLPSTNWNGFYTGVNAGYGGGRTSTTLTPNDAYAGVMGTPTNPHEYSPFPGSLKPAGFVGGGQIGFNFQSGPLLAGIEADLSYSDLSKSDSRTGPAFVGGQFVTTIDTKLDWFGTLRGRLGILASPSLLLYGTAGLAYGEVKTTTSGTNTFGRCDIGNFYCITGTASGVSTGWTAGGGFEYAFADRWTVKAEYLYADLGSRSVTFSDPSAPGSALTAKTNFNLQIVRAGLNYRFGN